MQKPQVCYKDSMKALIISILFLWASNSYGIACNASSTNNDPTVIAKCYAKMLTHFKELIQRELAYNYAYHLKEHAIRLTDGTFRQRHYIPRFTELEQIQRLLHKLHYPDPRPAVRCEAPSGDDDEDGN